VREVEVFGRRLLVERTATGWRTCVPGADGKRGPVSENTIPAFVTTDAELLQYLADLWHEEARPDRQTVRWIR
jgi:hypothetical protein